MMGTPRKPCQQRTGTTENTKLVVFCSDGDPLFRQLYLPDNWYQYWLVSDNMQAEMIGNKEKESTLPPDSCTQPTMSDGADDCDFAYPHDDELAENVTKAKKVHIDTSIAVSYTHLTLPTKRIV